MHMRSLAWVIAIHCEKYQHLVHWGPIYILGNTVHPHYTDIIYNTIILYNVKCTCTNVPVYIEFDFITT